MAEAENADLDPVQRARMDVVPFAPPFGLLDMRVGGGQIIDQKPAGSPIDIHISLDNAVVLKAVPEAK
jgi:hypothetical protein